MPNNQATINDNLDPLLAHAAFSPTLFLCGSGISIPPPAFLPSAWHMIDVVVSSLAPEVATDEEKDAIRDALPEVFYSGLFGLVGPVAVQPWTALTLHTREPNAFPYPVGPTAGHLVVTYLSWRHGVPIITTNFDTFFESAARVLGLSPVVCLPSPATEWKAAGPDRSEVVVWKVHGSANQPESICTTLEQISSLNLPLLSHLRDLFGQYRPCLVGYSGRDIDVFPFVASFRFHGNLPAFWLDINFRQPHGIFARPERFIGIRKSTDEFAAALVATLDDACPVAKPLRDAVKQSLLAREEVAAQATREVYLQAAQRVVHEQIIPLFKSSGTDHRLLLQAVSLANVQRFTWAVKHGEAYLRTVASCSRPLWGAKAWNLLSSCHHNLAKYKRSESAARQALIMAKRNGFVHEAVHALANIDEALRMQLDLDLSLNARPFVGKVKVLLLAARFFLDRLRLEAWSRSVVNQADSAHGSIVPVILEHRVRLLAILQGGLVRLGARGLAERLLTKRWKQIHDEAYRVGYAAGIGNALKYLRRVQRYRDCGTTIEQADELDVVSAQQVFDLMGHRTGLALILRDQADAFATEGRFDDAAPLYGEAAVIAQDMGNASLELKALLGLRSCGRAIDVQRVSLLADSIENDAQHAVKVAIMKRVAG